MIADLIIGIDAGTSVIKAVAFSTSGEQVAVASVANHYQTVEGGGVEQDMARTWRDSAATLKELNEKILNLPSRLLAISVTGQGDGTWLVDKAGEPVAPAWLWLDARAAAVAESYATHPNAAAHYTRTGTGVNACQMNVQLAFMKKNSPEILARAATAFHCKDWLYFKLTGQRATDPSEANFTFGDFRTREYKPQILDDLGASEAKRLLPKIVDGTERADGLSADAATLTGLRQGTPVVLGFVDVICTGLGGGLFDATGKTGCTIVGSTGMHMRVAPRADLVKLNAQHSGYTMCFPVPGMNAQIQSNMASTLNIDWLLDIARGMLHDQGVERNRSELLKSLDDKILQSTAGQILYHPYISAAGERGPFMDPAARAMFSGLEMKHGFADLMRAVFEGLCYAARDCYGAMGDIPTEIRVTGGAARSKTLRTILASTLNSNVRAVTREEAGAAGAAMMACVQQKIYPDMAACAAQWVDPSLGESTLPIPELSKIYDTTYPVYKQAREAMPPIWRAHATAKKEF